MMLKGKICKYRRDAMAGNTTYLYSWDTKYSRCPNGLILKREKSFLHSNTEKSENKIKETISFTIEKL